MSKDLALDQVEWDLHNNPESFIPLDFTEEVKPDLFGLEIAKATEMVSGLSVTLAEREVLKNAYIDVIDLEITKENLPIFRELRLKISKNRTQGIKKWKEKEKAFYLAGGNFVQAIYNKEISINEEMESKLLEAEKFFENQEKEKAKILNDKRIEIIKPYVDDVTGLDFSDFSDEDFDDYVLGKKTRHKEKIEAERIKAERIESENKKKALIEFNKKQLLPWKFYINDFESIDFGKVDLIEVLKIAKAKKEEAERIAKAQRKENEQLKAQAERIARELKAEAKVKAEAEAEAERIAKAPIKEQLSIWIDSFQLPKNTIDNDETKIIISKFQDFKIWSKKQIK